ncbi:MAG: OadG family transporter subunit [Parabacteroides sp.]|uniref:Na+-transporting methylmalonyl-CoA/oxaloacetate decarboxylase gamma subunit n=1 Tax=Macellibacteroides fermentans TaxID=879969 RepID=A0A8E1ZWG8_9PORP|nr:OadG family transporter subunit [Macellibacteroides fermentans]MBP7919345.1 lamin tail domain-containing protein [Parabacteroides sp.]MBP8012339.1 lamin tail domain-containing protein [Parabacteroides sp.]MDD3254847.1 OadG family transporter subunit [Parabacteroides sp.]MDD3508363.1 OadG family transporter subunit [Parabacteroides sp.]MDD4432389.1 OadG family transporter subunit [Parabacteroides sp.]
MIKKKIGILVLFATLFSLGINAQRATSIRINEILVVNEDNYVDDYGKHSGWIELFNSSAGTVDLKGCYITNDKNNLTKYMIPKGDVLTKIRPRQHTLFFADNNPGRGTFHVNFVLDPYMDNYIAIVDADGKTLIDEVTVPAGQIADTSYGRLIDGEKEWAQLTKVTPSTNNLTLDSNEKIDNFKQNDSFGIGMTVSAMAVTFMGLLLLYLIFKQVGKISIAASKRNAKKAKTGAINAENDDLAGEEAGEVFAAIATALYEVTEDVHDLENTVLTIHKVTRNYSPWSSKLYGLREIPRK